MSSYSVTEARNALRCPRVFALGRARGQQVAFPMGASTLGATFHRLVDVFAQHIESPPAAVRKLGAANTPEATEAVAAWLLSFLEHELETNVALHAMPAEVDDLAEALRELAKYLVVRSATAGRTTAEAISAFIAHAELAVDVAAAVPGDREVKLVGRIDAVHAPPEGPIEVVEYKLTDEANEDIDRAQVALYRYLLKEARGADAAPVLLRFNPALTVTRVPSAEADALVEKKLLPLLASMADWAADAASAPPPTRADLCPACPLRKPCIETYPSPLASRDDPPSGAARPRPTPDGSATPTSAPPVTAKPEHPPAMRDEAGAREADKFRKWILEILKSQQVPSPIAKPPVVGARLVQVEVSVKRGRVAWIDKAKEDVIHRLASEHQLAAQYEKRGGLRVFTIGRTEPRRVELLPILAAESGWMAARPGRFVLGETVDGRNLVGDLGDPASCHLLVGGATGSGKSVLLRAIAASLAQYHGPDAIRFTLVDPKRVTFTKLAASLSAHLAGPVCYDVEETQPVLDALVEEMEERYRAFQEARVQDIDEHNTVPGAEALARHVVIVDEFQDLVTSKATREPFLGAIRRLGAKARAAGIHLVLATQRPTKENVPGSVKANLPGKVALKTASALESRIILDAGGAEGLLGHGDFLADLGRGPVRGQAPLA